MVRDSLQKRSQKYIILMKDMRAANKAVESDAQKSRAPHPIGYV